MPQNVVGEQIRKHRYRSGLSQADLAARCEIAGFEISRGTLAKIEAGIRCVSDKELWIVAKALRVEIVDLYPSTICGIKR